jgi:hypothetical protein
MLKSQVVPGKDRMTDAFKWRLLPLARYCLNFERFCGIILWGCCSIQWAARSISPLTRSQRNGVSDSLRVGAPERLLPAGIRVAYNKSTWMNL